MNGLFGIAGRLPWAWGPTSTGHNWFLNEYRQFLIQGEIPQPEQTWATLDENPDSINDGPFIVDPNATQWNDTPGSYHNGACGFSFADGHAEIHKWRSRTSVYRVTYVNGGTTIAFDATGKQDFQWYKERTGYTH